MAATIESWNACASTAGTTKIWTMKPRVEPGGGGSWIPTAEMALARTTPSTTPATAPSTPRTKPSSTNIDTTPRRRVPSAITVPISRVRSKMAMVMVLVMPNTTMIETISVSTAKMRPNSSRTWW